MGWEQGLEKYGDSQEVKNAVKWFKSTADDIKEKDIIEIITSKDKVIFYKNGKPTHESTDNTIIKLALAPWIGKYPIDKKIKKELLGKK